MKRLWAGCFSQPTVAIFAMRCRPSRPYGTGARRRFRSPLNFVAKSSLWCLPPTVGDGSTMRELLARTSERRPRSDFTARNLQSIEARRKDSRGRCKCLPMRAYWHAISVYGRTWRIEMDCNSANLPPFGGKKSRDSQSDQYPTIGVESWLNISRPARQLGRRFGVLSCFVDV